MRTILALMFLSCPVLAADPQVHRDLAYAEPKNERQAEPIIVSRRTTFRGKSEVAK